MPSYARRPVDTILKSCAEEKYTNKTWPVASLKPSYARRPVDTTLQSCTEAKYNNKTWPVSSFFGIRTDEAPIWQLGD
jgi:hypothetical protein